MRDESGTAWRLLSVATDSSPQMPSMREVHRCPDFAVVRASSPGELSDRLAEGVDLAICHHSEDRDAVDIVESITGTDPSVPVVVIGPDDGSFASRAIAAGARGFVPRNGNETGVLVSRVRDLLTDVPRLRADGVARMPIEDLGVQEELRLKERAMDAAPVGITISDPDQPDNPLIYLNDAFERLTGYGKDETVGRNCRFLQGERSDEEAVVAMRDAIDREESVSVELINYRKDGETFWNKVDIAPIRDASGTVTNYVGFQTDITARKEAEFEVKRERAQLDHLLSRINGLIREVTAALVEAVSRADVERAVSERIASADIYTFAWIGQPDLSSRRIVPSAWAGRWDPNPEDLEVPLGDASDGDEEGIPSPVARAYETGELQVITDADSLAAIVDRHPWLTAPDLQGIVAVPLVYRDTRYGVLTVYSVEPEALNERETVVLGALGRATATAINAIERGRILAADNVVELEFSVNDRDLFFVDLSTRADHSVVYNGSVFKEDGTALMFFTSAIAPETVEEVMEAHEEVQDVTLISQTEEGSLYEFSVAEDSIITVLAERGARTRSLTAEDGVGTITVELPTEADARAILELLQNRYGDIELTAYRERERPPETKQEFIGELKDTLTERQLTALQRAYVSGYYEWNRPVSGDDLANSMGVARSTYHQHLRAAERKLIGEIFDR